MASKTPGQKKWTDLQLPDIRTLDKTHRRDPLEEVEAAETIEAAIEIVEFHLGFSKSLTSQVCIETPIGKINVQKEKIFHIVEKRKEARERYVLYAIDTLLNPYEVWKVQYDNNTLRLTYIGAYKTKNQMSVTVDIREEHILWNFMHCEAKALNRHRNGELIYVAHRD